MPPSKKLSQSIDRLQHGGAVVLADEAAFGDALRALESLDKAFMEAMREAGELPRLRRRTPGFAGLAAIVISQQVSTASANAIFARLEEAFPQLSAQAILDASDDALRACGLSAGKARTLRAIAAAEAEGTLDFTALATLPAEESHARLCAIKGIGPWTADIFLLFCLGHSDAWPAGDLAVQEGARLVLDLETRPDRIELIEIGERWRPLRGVVAHCLWAYYGHKRGRPGTLDATAARMAPPPEKAAAKSRPSRIEKRSSQVKARQS